MIDDELHWIRLLGGVRLLQVLYVLDAMLL
jgi:hypothetical protein